VSKAVDSEHFACPFCNSYDVSRLYIASIDLDSCECLSCGARWDQEQSSGKYRGRSDRSSVLAPRNAR
jgi:transcription elongation factor Elf1